MKKKLLSILLCLVMVVGLLPTAVLAADDVEINETNFPDANFRSFVQTEFDKNGDKKLSSTEIAAVKKIEANNKGIKSLKGVGFFTALETLTCGDNELTGLDLSKNTALKELQCSNSKLQSLDLSQNTNLTYLYCGRNPLTTLDLSKNANLKVLNCSGFASKHMKLTELDLSKNTALESLDCSLNELKQLNVSGCTALYKLDCSGNQLKALDVSTNADLIELLCSSNELVALDVSENTKLEKLYCWDNFLAALDVSKNTKLESIDCKKNRLTSLDLDNNENITDVNFDNQQFYNSTLLAGGTFNLNDLPGNFVPGRATNWVGGTVNEATGILTVNASATKVTYTYKTKSGSEDPKYLMPCELQVQGGTTPPTTYTVSFDANGGTGTMADVTGVTGSYTLPACTFTAPSDKQFKGWATSASGPVITDTSINVTENTTLYAIWKPIPATTYTVSFDANGGTGTMADVTGINGSYALPACTFTAPSDKQFKGWATSASGTVITGTSINVTENTTLYAIWEPIPVTTYTVSFDANGGSGTMADVTGINGSYALPACTFTAPSDKQFKGWATSASGAVITDTSINVTENTTLYAIWKPIPVTKPAITTVALPDGKVGEAYSQTLAATGTNPITWSIEAGALPDGLTLVGDTIKGTPSKAGEFKFTVKATNGGGSDTKELTIKIADAEAAKYHNVTLTGAGTGATGAGSHAAGTTVNIYAGTKSGYTFNGWTSDDVTVLSASSKNASFVMPDKDVTVKANWVYNGGGSSGGGYTYYTIKATAGVNGSISPTGNVSVREGRDQTFTITPNKGYAVAKVLIDSKNVGAVKSYTFENVKKNHTIEVVFMKASGNPQTGVFVDVPEGSYYEEAVNWAVEKGITTGTDATHFSPDGICTRAQAVTFLWRAAGSPAAKSAVMPFADVKVGSYYYNAVLWAVENGITKGTSDTMFSPDATCSRAQIVTFLWRSQKSPAAGTANPFTDVKASAYYADAVLWAVKEDVTKGTTNTTFSPDANCTRAQIVTFIWRALAE